MTIEFKPGRYFVAQWYLEGPAQNFMGALYRDGDGPWTFKYRFRYYADDKIWGSKDTRSWTTATYAHSTTEAAAEAIVDHMVEMIVHLGYLAPGHKVEKLEMRCEGNKAIDKLMEAPWAHPGRACIQKDPLGHYIIVDRNDPTLAWSGSRWVKHNNGLPVDVQICNYATLEEAAKAAREIGG